jgi:hypothetical protein
MAPGVVIPFGLWPQKGVEPPRPKLDGKCKQNSKPAKLLQNSTVLERRCAREGGGYMRRQHAESAGVILRDYYLQACRKPAPKGSRADGNNA